MTTDPLSPSRCGFVVAKNVGGAVTRNRVRRQLRSLAHSTIVAYPSGLDMVVRVLPEAAEASFAELSSAWGEAFESELRK